MLQKYSSQFSGMSDVGEFEYWVALPVRKFEGERFAMLFTSVVRSFGIQL